MSERDITIEEAEKILVEHGGYGKVRIYHTYPSSSPYAGQINSIKSETQLGVMVEQGYARLYAVGNDGSLPIRKA